MNKENAKCIFSDYTLSHMTKSNILYFLKSAKDIEYSQATQYLNVLCTNPNLTMDMIELYPNLPWEYKNLIRSKNLTWNFINKHLHAFDSKIVSSHPNITWDIVKNNPSYPWDYYYLLFNENITWDIIIKNKSRPWALDLLFYWDYMGPFKLDKFKESLTIDHVLQLLYRPWNFMELSKYPNFTLKSALLLPNKNWDWSLLRSKYISSDDGLSVRLYHNFIVNRIWSKYHNASFSPKMFLCKKRLRRLYNETN
jgi:hypothetical protein